MACEKCWSDAGIIAMASQTSKVDEYAKLMEERKETPCTPEEQCGELHVLFDWKDGTRHCVCGKRRSVGQKRDSLDHEVPS